MKRHETQIQKEQTETRKEEMKKKTKILFDKRTIWFSFETNNWQWQQGKLKMLFET